MTTFSANPNPVRKSRGLSIPDNYAAERVNHTREAAAKYWEVGETTILRWDGLAGYVSARRQHYWSPEDDVKLREMIAAHGTWREITESFPGRNRDGCASRAHILGLTLTPEGQSRARRIAQERRKPNPSNRKTGIRSRSKTVGDNFSKIVTDTQAQAIQRQLQRIVPVFYEGREKPALRGVWNVDGRRMSEAEMFERYADYKRRGKL